MRLAMVLVVLRVESIDALKRPSVSGTFVLYGLCHELGHVAQYRALKERAWLTTAGAEGWAHYAGSVVVDEVHAKKGEGVWPDKYDYLADGTARLKRQLTAAKPSEVDREAGAWMDLEAIIGRERAFDLALCDEKWRPIITWKKPYTVFERADPKWARIPVEPTKVPAEFSMMLDFNPTARSGVYVSYDGGTSGSSVSGKPGKPGGAYPRGDWMIRVEVDRVK